MSGPVAGDGLLAGRYEVLEQLGSGGEARVVKALDHQHGRTVALKIRRVRDSQAREELLGEARLLLGLEPHPALPLVREDFFAHDEYVVAMDWVEGTDLGRILAERGSPGLAPSSVVAWLAEAAEALAHLHAQDPPVVHGDVKPANLILTRGSRVKLVDFGLSSTPLMPGRRSGTPGFRAPELATGAAPSTAGDVYGLAATAFALLTGAPPDGVLPAWEGVDPALAAQLESALRAGLATDPDRRPATPGDLVERLRAGWAATLPTGAATFCLSDIVGSTELWERDPAAMAASLVRHDEIVATAVESHGGRFLKSKGEGDATFSVFESASGALRAAVAATRALEAEPWPGGWTIAVRFGLHTGEAERRDADYFGPAVNLAARVRGQAGAAEILLSQRTAELLAGHLPAGCTLVDLGPHRLRGIEGAQTLYALTGPGIAAPLPATQSPYRGLQAFGTEDRELFFGREDIARSVLERLEPGRLLALVGASGSGKSSLLRAGVVAAVQAGEVPGITGARLQRPGPHPRLEPGEDDGTLVVVDQFEELYTLCRDPAERDRSIDALLASAGPVVIGVRADFYGELSAHPQLAAAVAGNQVLLGAMGEDGMRRAVTEPARLAGLRLEPGLVDVVLGEVSGEPGALPLLSHALHATWERRDGRTLTIDAYRASGGVASAVAQSADDVVQAVPDGQRRLLRGLFLRLTELGDGVDDTRRRVPITDLVPGGVAEQAVRDLVDRFADARLLTLGEGTVEVAHEVLIREWPMLRGWLEEDREGLRLHRRLGDASRIWDAAGRDPTDLYRGTRLGAALEWAQAHPDALNATERAFLDASADDADRERRQQARANRRLRALLTGAGLLLVAAVVAGVLALRAGDDARDSARTADAQRLGAQALVDDRIDRSFLLAQAGRTLEDSVATRSRLFSAIVRHPAALGVMQAGSGDAAALALSPDDELLAAGEFEGRVVLLDPRSRKRVGAFETGHAVESLDFSPDGRLLAVGGLQTLGPDGSSVQLVDAATRRTVREFSVAPYPADPELVPFTDARFSADGRAVVVTLWPGSTGGPNPVFVRRYDVRSGKQLGRTLQVGRRSAHVGLREPGRRDRLLVSGTDENATYVVDPDRLRVLRRLPRGGHQVALAPDGRTAALGGAGGSVAVLDLRTGVRRALAGRHEDRVTRLAFSADGRTLVSTADDSKVLVWDLRSGEVRETLTGHSGRILCLEVTRDGRTLYTAGLDRRIIAWDITGRRRLARPFAGANLTREVAGTPIPPALAITADGRRVAAGLRGGGVRIHDARRLRKVGELPGIEGLVASAVEFSPDGRLLAVTGTSGVVELRDARTGRRVRPALPGLAPAPTVEGLPPGPALSQALAFSPDGTRLAVPDIGGNLRLLDVRSGRVRRARVPPYAVGVSFSPDGEILAVTGGESGVELRDGRTLRVLAGLHGRKGFDRWVRFSPDGRLLAVTSDGGTVQIWDVAERRRSAPPLVGHEGAVLSAEFSPDGRMLSTTGVDGTVILWDVASRRVVGTLPGRFGWTMARFAPDGRRLFLLRDTGEAERWEVDPDAWSRHACRVAGRDLSAAEWTEFVPDQDRRPVCGRA